MFAEYHSVGLKKSIEKEFVEIVELLRDCQEIDRKLKKLVSNREM